MKKKNLLLLIAGAMVVTMFTSCSNSGESEPVQIAVDEEEIKETQEIVQEVTTESSEELAEPTEDELIIEFITTDGDGDAYGIWNTQYSVGYSISSGKTYNINENEFFVVKLENIDSKTVNITGSIFQGNRIIGDNIIVYEFEEEFNAIYAVEEDGVELFSVTFKKAEPKESSTEDVSEEISDIEIPEGLTFDEFITYILWETDIDIDYCEFVLWKPEIGTGRIVTGETVVMDDDEMLILYYNISTTGTIKDEIITGDADFGMWEYKLLVNVNSPGEITVKMTDTATNEEYVLSCVITE